MTSVRLPNALLVPDHDLIERIGRGGYGEVWLARNRTTGTLRAVKIVFRDEFEDERPYQREFEGLLKFEPISRSHPSQLAILHVGRNDEAGCFYYVMELADPGELKNEEGRMQNSSEAQSASAVSSFGILPSYFPKTLRSEIKSRRRLPAAEVIELGRALTTALAHLHSHGLVHRDIKPANIVYVGGVPKLADIGLVTDASDACSIVGTEGYIPPEGPGSPQADLYGLGKVFYEAATGRDRRDYPALPDDLRSWFDVKLLTELNAVILRACAPDSKSRYQSADEMRGDLELLQHGQSVKRKRAIAKWWNTAKKIVLATSAIVLTVASAIFGLHPSNRNRTTTSNPTALTLYDKARFQLQSYTPEGARAAYTNLTKAVALDRKFIDAQYLLFEVYLDSWGENLPPHHDRDANQRAVAETLKNLDPDCAQYHTVNAWINFCQWNFEKAIAEAETATRRDPQFRHAHHFYGWFLLLLRGDVEKAREELAAGAGTAGSDAITLGGVAHVYYFEGQFDKAIEIMTESQVGSRSASGWLGQFYEAAGQYDKAIDENEAFERIYSDHPAEIKVKYEQQRSALNNGRNEWWEMRLKQVSHSDSPDDLYDRARALTRLGRKAEAIELLKRLCKEQAGHMVFLLHDDCWDPLRDDPGFDGILEKMHLPKIKPRRK